MENNEKVVTYELKPKLYSIMSLNAFGVNFILKIVSVDSVFHQKKFSDVYFFLIQDLFTKICLSVSELRARRFFILRLIFLLGKI